MHLQLIRIYLNCVIAKYTLPLILARKPHLQGDLYTNDFWWPTYKICTFKHFVKDNSNVHIEQTDIKERIIVRAYFRTLKVLNILLIIIQSNN
jgi:hypothetical protein